MVVSHLQTLLADAGGGDHMGGLGWSMMGMGWLVMLIILILILVIWAVIRLVDGPSRGVPSATASASRILADRYARGEIDSSEYRERLSELA